ncbi:MAG TPA: alpha/beta fold hydrolase [Rhizomicrobium sp.]|nr:alpha/beta fold hydrolase [Rhizomicrobium sp.]
MRILPLVLVGLVTPSLAMAADPRAIIGELQKIVTPNGIDERLEVPINGTKQWITVRGRDASNPILLFVHGGPAAPEMPTSWTFQNPWEDYFTVVQWDQRGSGKTYNANGGDAVRPTMSLDMMEKDAQALVEYLRATYHKKKIFVLGHSWGTILGLKLAQAHPEWLYAYVGMGQMIDSRASERLGYEATLKAAEDAHNAQAIKELKAIAPYPEPDGNVPLEKIDIERKWSVAFGGLSWKRDGYGYYYHATQLSPDYTDADLEAIDKGSALSLPILLPAMTRADFTKVTAFRCPIVIFNGRHDDTTSSKVVADWFEHVTAPSKKLVWFENSAHMMQIEEPGRVLVHLVEDVRPLAD